MWGMTKILKQRLHPQKVSKAPESSSRMADFAGLHTHTSPYQRDLDNRALSTPLPCRDKSAQIAFFGAKECWQIAAIKPASFTKSRMRHKYGSKSEEIAVIYYDW